MIQRLLQQSPKSTYATEANSIAEDAFSAQRYRDQLQAIRRYWSGLNRIIVFGHKPNISWRGRFIVQGVLKRRLYRLKHWINHFTAQPTLSSSEQVRLDDSYRTLSLVFVQLGGAPALANYYANQALSAEQI